MLALHGFLDNCGTFDRLFPLLNAKSIVAIDIPGHGFSSHIPDGIFYNYLDILFWLRSLIKGHFNWDRVDLLGHSFGSSLAYFYSSLYPNDVGKFVSIDCARYAIAPTPENFRMKLKASFDGNPDAKNKQNVQLDFKEHYDDFVNFRLIKNCPLTDDAYEALIKREVKEVAPNKFIRTSDLRLLACYKGTFALEFIEAAAKQIKCSVLSIRASRGILANNFINYEKHLDLMKSSCQKLVRLDVEGSHHVHLETPVLIADQINEFLLEK
ncbi:probable serine hydrolase [Cimex lectularius]|uniref:AB hydrolase-1 domain-containing protein n=1 Tax=Cimex lectularius TaxID=79782 RepID=A0A8I6SRK6_CIMLE|nr:probable serine hydrolase [Cimex lectularius]